MTKENASPDHRPHLLVFGPGYTARAVMARAADAGWRLSGTYRRTEAKADLHARGVAALDIEAISADSLADVTHVLMSIAPKSGDPVLPRYEAMISAAPHLRWIGYLSSTNVYGDHGGAWVDEDTPPAPGLARGQRRVEAEALWQACARAAGVPLSIFRLAGIYGPGRNALESLRTGKARRIIQPGQVFSRIHVEDIAAAVMAAMDAAATLPPYRIYNLADDAPAPPQDVIVYAAKLLGVDPPPAEPLEEAEMSDMARSFYSESKRVRADRIKDELGVRLAYPTYQAGLDALIHDSEKSGG